MLAFVHIHKNGGQTIHNVLRSSYGGHHFKVQPWGRLPAEAPLRPWAVSFDVDDLTLLMRLFPGVKSIAGHYIQPYVNLESICSGLRYITFMRDPVKMRASMYQNAVRKLGKDHIPLDVWLNNGRSGNRQTRMIAGCEDVEQAIRIINEKKVFIGLTDRFDESLLLLRSLVAPDLKVMYRSVNVAANNAIAKQLVSDKKTIARLSEGNEADISLYEYVTQEIYPNYVKEYGINLDRDVADFQESLKPFKEDTVDTDLIKGPWVYKALRLLVDTEPFNRKNYLLYSLTNHLHYKPLLAWYQVFNKHA